MNFEDRKAFALAMGSMGLAFNITPTKPQMEIYFEALDSLPIEAVQHAVKEAIKTEERWPNPKRIRDLASTWRRPPLPPSHQVPYTPAPLAKEKLTAILEAVESGDFSKLEGGPQ